MRWLVVLFLGLASLAQTSEARACTCISLSPSEGRSVSHAIFTGEVTEIAPNKATRFGGLEITLRVKRMWKGDPEQEIKVHTAGSSAACGYTFVKGETYLVYALRDDADPMRVSLCSRTALAKKAKDDLDFLGEPKHQFDGGKGGCAAASGSTDGAGLALFALLLLGAMLVTRRRLPLLAVAIMCVSLFGCSGVPPKPALMANMAKADITVTQLRAIDYGYADRFGQLVAACVTEIIARSDDPQLRDRAYEWRMWAMPQARAAAFDQDPFVGLVELWVLAKQQRLYFAKSGDTSYFDTPYECVSETTRSLEEEVERIVSTVVNEEHLKKMAPTVRAWVEEHPIEGQLFVRPTARADLAGLVPAQKQGGLKAVASIEETFRDLNDRITILTVQMPTEARWQAEYLTNSLFEERVQQPAESMLEAMETMTDFIGEFEGILGAQTNALLAGITAERIAVFDAVEDERTEILATIEKERASVMGKLDEQLLSATTELDQVGRGLIDHFFVRLIEVLAGVGVASFLTVLLVLVVLRKRRSSDD
jgi:MYXO-CTERM domain-containing protein